jgi:hypothetical protein
MSIAANSLISGIFVRIFKGNFIKITQILPDFSKFQVFFWRGILISKKAESPVKTYVVK